MRRFMVFTWVGFAALSAVFMSLAVILDFPNEPGCFTPSCVLCVESDAQADQIGP